MHVNCGGFGVGTGPGSGTGVGTGTVPGTGVGTGSGSGNPDGEPVDVPDDTGTGTVAPPMDASDLAQRYTEGPAKSMSEEVFRRIGF